jgi:hypothetical protein
MSTKQYTLDEAKDILLIETNEYKNLLQYCSMLIARGIQHGAYDDLCLPNMPQRVLDQTQHMID